MDIKSIFSRDDLKKRINANPYHTIDYAGGFASNVEAIETPDGCGFLLLYKSQEELTEDILSNLETLDLMEGPDDQYYDYNPSCVEAIIYALPALLQQTQEEALETLKNKLKSFIKDEDQDSDMRDQYRGYLNAITEYSINRDASRLRYLLID